MQKSESSQKPSGNLWIGAFVGIMAFNVGWIIGWDSAAEEDAKAQATPVPAKPAVMKKVGAYQSTQVVYVAAHAKNLIQE